MMKKYPRHLTEPECYVTAAILVVHHESNPETRVHAGAWAITLYSSEPEGCRTGLILSDFQWRRPQARCLSPHVFIAFMAKCGWDYRTKTMGLSMHFYIMNAAD